jgi:hypothetical protein
VGSVCEPAAAELHAGGAKAANARYFLANGGAYAGAVVPGTATIWDMRAGSVLLSLPLAGSDNIAAFDPAGSYVAVDTGTAVALWKMSERRHIFSIPQSVKVTLLLFSQDEKHLAIGNVDNSVEVYRMPDGTRVETPFAKLDNVGYNRVLFSRKGTIARFHGKVVETGALGGRKGSASAFTAPALVTLAEFDPAAERLAVATNDGRVSVATLGGQPKLMDTTIRHRAGITRLQFSDNGNALIAFTENWAHHYSIGDGAFRYTGSRLLFDAIAPVRLRQVAPGRFQYLARHPGNIFERMEVRFDSADTVPGRNWALDEWQRRLGLKFDPSGNVVPYYTVTIDSGSGTTGGSW